MEKNGFTVIDALIVIVLVGVSALFVIPNISNALEVSDNKNEVYNEILENYISIAEKYGNDKKEDIKAENKIISLDDLIKEGYLHPYSEEIIDIRDNTTKMNNIKFKLIYNTEEDKVYAEVI